MDKSRVINSPDFVKRTISQNMLICGWGGVDNVKNRSWIDLLLENVDHLDHLRILIRLCQSFGNLLVAVEYGSMVFSL